MLFMDRIDAGRQLAARLVAMGLPSPVVLALPRGGVPVGAEVARALHAPLDLVLVRKIGAPMQPELAVAALAQAAGEQPVLEVDEETLALSGATHTYVQQALPAHQRELDRRRALYLKGRPPTPLEGCTAVVVDDGIATGTTMRAALRAVRHRHPQRLVLAVPVAPADAVRALRGEVDALVCLHAPEFFGAVGGHYREFDQTSDAEVVALMSASSAASRDDKGGKGGDQPGGRAEP